MLNITKPVDAAANLKIRPGLLNPLDQEQPSIDFQATSGAAVLAYVIRKALEPNKFKSQGTLIGIMLAQAGGCTPLDTVIGATGVSRENGKYKLPSYRVLVPELHFMLAVPNSLLNPSPTDRIIIDTYPICQSINANVAKEPVKPGDFVIIKLTNNNSLEGLQYWGPLDSTRTDVLKADILQAQKCLANCKKEYTNAGAPGDNINAGANQGEATTNQMPSTNPIGPLKKCEAKCLPSSKVTKPPPEKPPKDDVKCKDNPLGLENVFKWQQKSSSAEKTVAILHSKKSWASSDMFLYIKKVLDNQIWKDNTVWQVGEISLESADGFKRLGKRNFHRFGEDVELGIPMVSQKTALIKKSASTSSNQKVDIFRLVTLLVLSEKNGAKEILINKKIIDSLKKWRDSPNKEKYSFTTESNRITGIIRNNIYFDPDNEKKILSDSFLKPYKGYPGQMQVKMYKSENVEKEQNRIRAFLKTECPSTKY